VRLDIRLVPEVTLNVNPSNKSTTSEDEEEEEGRRKKKEERRRKKKAQTIQVNDPARAMMYHPFGSGER